MRRVSLNARRMQDDEVDAEIAVVLFEFSHPSLAAPIRLSTDNKDVISRDPYYLGTRSTWRGANPITDPYLWIVASAVLPSDEDDMPASATLVLENLDSKMVEVVRSFTDVATVAIAVVMASSPNLVEFEHDGLELVSSDIDAGQIVLSLSREEIEMERFPPGRMTRQRFPGLFL